jgi:hypothetical protein
LNFFMQKLWKEGVLGVWINMVYLFVFLSCILLVMRSWSHNHHFLLF